MIAQVRGVVLHRDATSIVIDLHGLGLRVSCTPRALAQARGGSEVTLPTAMIVREESWQLYGFLDDAERDTFVLLQSVSGIGPRIALAAVSTLEPDRIAAAIAGNDLALLTKIPGIGRKGAERMCIELRDRLTGSTAAAPDWQSSVREALIGLGWSAQQAESAVGKVADSGATADVSEALRAALQILGRR